MKKVLALLLVLAMMLSFAACTETNDGNDKNTGDGTNAPVNTGDNGGENKGDGNAAGIEGYPADFNEWTAEDVLNYFVEKVNFPSDTETWVQNHEEYWANYPVWEVSGAWNANGADDFMVMFTVFNPDAPDTTSDEVEAVKQAIKDDPTHNYTTDEIFLGVQDHMIGNVAFSYGLYILDENLYNEMEAAYNELVAAMGLTPDF